MIVVLAQDHRWIRISPQGASVVRPYTPLHEACYIVWLPAHVTGEMSLQGDTSHAAPLIERRELASGSIDAESRTFIHRIYPADSAYQAAYSIAPLSRWQEIAAWAKSQPYHCVLGNVTSLAWSLVSANQAVVIQDGLTFTFWAVVRNRIVHSSLVAMGEGSEDTCFAAEALGQRVDAALSEHGEFNHSIDHTPLRVKWLSVLRKQEEGEHAAALLAFKEAAKLEVETADLPYDTGTKEGVIASAMPALAQLAPKDSIIGPPGSRFLLLADKWLPICSLFALVVGIGLVSLAAYWLVQANQIEKTTQVQREKLAEKPAVLLDPAKKTATHLDFDAQLSFLNAMRQLQSGHDLVDALQALKRSVRGGMRILSVRSALEADAKAAGKAPAPARPYTRALIVDGMLPDSSHQDVLLLSEFIRSLESSGYTAEAVDGPSSAAASSTSIRLFSYRIYPKGRS